MEIGIACWSGKISRKEAIELIDKKLQQMIEEFKLELRRKQWATNTSATTETILSGSQTKLVHTVGM